MLCQFYVIPNVFHNLNIDPHKELYQLNIFLNNDRHVMQNIQQDTSAFKK